MQFRPRDLHDLVLTLTKQHTESFVVEGDTGGLLKVSWADHLGQYSVYMPTATNEGRQESRRLIQMRPEDAVAEEMAA
jgi:hypothetical protein